MSRIFWDSMLFVYLLEGDPAYSTRAEYLLRRALERVALRAMTRLLTLSIALN